MSRTTYRRTKIVATLGPSWDTPDAMRALLDGLDVIEMRWTDPGPPPWFDCDTDEDVRRAEEWVR